MKLRVNGSMVASIAIHVVVAGALLQALVSPRHLTWIFTGRASPDAPIERLRYIVVAPEPAGGALPAPASAPRASSEPAVPPPPLVAPTEIPTTIEPPAPAPPAPPAGVPGGTGTGTDPDARGGAVSLVPRSIDPRLFARGDYVPPPTTHVEELQSSLSRVIRAGNDSLAAEAARTRRPGDWTFERDGRKYGMDERTIYFGRFSVPSVLLALLPIRGAQANPILAERYERIDEMSAEIRERAPLAGEAEAELKRINERKARERAARLRAAGDMSAKAPVVVPRPARSAGSGSHSTLPPPP